MGSNSSTPSKKAVAGGTTNVEVVPVKKLPTLEMRGKEIPVDSSNLSKIIWQGTRDKSEIVPIVGWEENGQVHKDLKKADWHVVKVMQDNAENRAGYDAYSVYSLFPTWRNLWRVILCVVIQIGLPILIIIETFVEEKLTCGEKGNWSAKISVMVMTLYLCSYLRTKYISIFDITWRNAMFEDCGGTFEFMQNGWSVYGLYVNFLSLALSGVGAVIITFQTDDAAGVILNALAIFFMNEVDDYLISEEDYAGIAYLTSTCLDLYEANHPELIKIRPFSGTLHFLHKFHVLAKKIIVGFMAVFFAAVLVYAPVCYCNLVPAEYLDIRRLWTLVVPEAITVAFTSTFGEEQEVVVVTTPKRRFGL